MKMLKWLVIAAFAAMCFTVTAPKAAAQVSVSIGAEPACPYGYYDYAPYACAPYGYYGPEWFTGGVFIGTGPWYHGHAGFRGHVDNHFDVNHGYKGPMPKAGEHADANKDIGHDFKGNEMHDEHGKTVR